MVGDNRCDDEHDEPHDSLALRGLTIAGHGFLLIFADDDSYQGPQHGRGIRVVGSSFDYRAYCHVLTRVCCVVVCMISRCDSTVQAQ